MESKQNYRHVDHQNKEKINGFLLSHGSLEEDKLIHTLVLYVYIIPHTDLF